MVAGGPKSIGPYTNRQRILIVGDGDFSFSLAIASAIGGEGMVCTSLDKDTQLQVKYGEGVKGTMGTLQSLGATVLHDVDATRLSDYAFMQTLSSSRTSSTQATFARIVFNFPDVGCFDGEKVDPALNRALLQGFLAAAAAALAGEQSEIHIALRQAEVKDLRGRIKKVCREAGLECVSVENFLPHKYPGYKPRHTFPGSNRLSPLTPASILTFKLRDPSQTDDEDDVEEEEEEGAEVGEEGEEGERRRGEEGGEEGGEVGAKRKLDEGREEGEGEEGRKKKKKKQKKKKRRKGNTAEEDLEVERGSRWARGGEAQGAGAAAGAAAAFLFG